jgi:hypothetical protein
LKIPFLRLYDGINYLSFIESTVLDGILTDSLEYNSTFFKIEAEKKIKKLDESIIRLYEDLEKVDDIYKKELNSSKRDPGVLEQSLARKKEIEKEIDNLDWDIYDIENNLDNYLQNDHRAFQYLKETLAKKAGEILFKGLWYATIDLDKADAEAKGKISERQVLQIYLLWSEKGDLASSQDTLSKPVELPLTSFKIKKMGWEVSVSAAPMLIYRFNENLVREDVLNSTQFYPAAGTVLRIGYHNDKRIYPRRSAIYNSIDSTFKHKKISGPARLAKAMEPSFGIHVALLDFYRTTEANPVEFGFGLSLGLFRDRISVLGGYNLNVQREQPWYMGIGFDFVDIFNSKND